MCFWYVLELKCCFDKAAKTLGEPISAEIAQLVPRKPGASDFEWHDTEQIENGVYTLRKWVKTKKDADAEIKFWLRAKR